MNKSANTSENLPIVSKHQDNLEHKSQGNEDDEISAVMTASYSEISFHDTATASGGYYGDVGEASTSSGIQNINVEKHHSTKLSAHSSPQRPASLSYNNRRKASFPYNLEGTVSIDGNNMTNYVTENLEYKIKLSSPNTKNDSSFPSSRNSTPSTSILLPKQFLQQSQHIDVNVLNDVEVEAQYLAASVDNLTENLCNLLHSISSITADNVETYKNSVNKLTDCMDSNIKGMYTIMAKTEEISNAMKPTEQLAVRIREIKRLVDMLESNM